MASKNELTGDLLISKRNNKAFEEGYTAIFGDKKAEKRGRYIQCKETGQLLSVSEYHAKYGKQESVNLPALHIFKPYTSPIDGKVIDSPNKMRDDLARSGSRLYEGFEVEQKIADQNKAEINKSFENEMSEALEKTAIQIRDKMVDTSANKPFNILED